MATYTLSGTGIQSLTSGTARLFVEITTYPGGYSFGRAEPANLYDIGLLRLGVGAFFYPAEPIDAGNMVIDLPSGVTQLGYNLFGDTAISVGEGAPPGTPTATLTTSVDGTTVTLPATISLTWTDFTTATVNSGYNIVDVGAVAGDPGWTDVNTGGYLNPADHTSPPATPQTSGTITFALHNWNAKPSGTYNVAVIIDDPAGNVDVTDTNPPLIHVP